VGKKPGSIAHIFLINDDGQIRIMLRQLLEAEGYEDVDASNGKEGIRLYREDPADLIITDIVKRPEDFRWNSLGYHVQTNNQDNFLSTDFGLKEFNIKSIKERIRRYRRYVYEAGAVRGLSGVYSLKRLSEC